MKLSDIQTVIPRMDLHIHTTYSDGQSSMRDVAKIAQKKNINYIAFTDHAFSNGSDGIDEDTINMYIEEAEKVKIESSVNVFVGVEAEIATIKKVMKYRDMLDLVLISNHGPVRGTFCSAILGIMNDYPVDIIAHPWYIKNSDWDKISDAAINNDVAIELNCFRKVPEFSVIKKIASRGVKFSVGSDAHFEREIGEISWAYDILKMLDIGSESMITF